MSFKQQHPETGESILKKVFFPIPHAKIPIMTPSGPVLAQWGKRQGEDPEIEVPITGWARLKSLVDGKWNHYQPKRVRIPALSWMEKDPQRESHWFDMADNTYLLGVKIEKADQSFVYIVTHPAEKNFAHIHSRMPLIVQTPLEGTNHL